jgi:hypothetical protein
MTDDDFADWMANEFSDAVIRTSEQRKADPLPFALDALEDLFRYESDKEQGFARFQRKLEQFVPWADDAVQCLELVLKDPPPDLGRIVREQAGITIWVDTPEGERVGDDADTEAWLRKTVPRLRQMLEDYVAERMKDAPPS